MKRLWFLSVGELPLKSAHDDWVDLKYLEKGIHCRGLLVVCVCVCVCVCVFVCVYNSMYVFNSYTFNKITQHAIQLFPPLTRIYPLCLF